jgi:hypothetical protein
MTGQDRTKQSNDNRHKITIGKTTQEKTMTRENPKKKDKIGLDRHNKTMKKWYMQDKIRRQHRHDITKTSDKKESRRKEDKIIARQHTTATKQDKTRQDKIRYVLSFVLSCLASACLVMYYLILSFVLSCLVSTCRVMYVILSCLLSCPALSQPAL